MWCRSTWITFIFLLLTRLLSWHVVVGCHRLKELLLHYYFGVSIRSTDWRWRLCFMCPPCVGLRVIYGVHSVKVRCSNSWSLVIIAQLLIFPHRHTDIRLTVSVLALWHHIWKRLFNLLITWTCCSRSGSNRRLILSTNSSSWAVGAFNNVIALLLQKLLLMLLKHLELTS